MRETDRRRVFIGRPEDAFQPMPESAVVIIDVLLSTTTVVTSVAQGRRTVLTGSVDEARQRARDLTNPILASEPGFTASDELMAFTGPSRLTKTVETGRPLVLVAPTARLTVGRSTAYFACLRNLSATTEALALDENDVYVISAGHAGQARCEDELLATWTAQRLLAMGFEAGNLRTLREIERWSRAEVKTVGLGRGADYLRRLGHEEDVDFVLSRVDDLDVVCRSHGTEVRAHWPRPALVAAGSH
jgi:phosphosulfolactate phosphohydrolase-like enzyme